MHGRAATTGLIVALLVAALALLLGGCGLFGGDETVQTQDPATTGETLAPVTDDLTGDTAAAALDELSTFQSKDPFRQQALPPTTATTGTGTTGATTSTTGNGATTTTQPSGIKTALHSLKVLSIDVINGVPTVTFEVDDTVYEDKKVGAVVSTSWGQIEVISIDAEDQVVVFLHGSELRTLGVGQEFLK
ncbi:MAG: hypothetical protein KKA32_01085 [Actinobacteria bacterium]|nr:hypothetical protein [Actinomycetota bacterium]